MDATTTTIKQRGRPKIYSEFETRDDYNRAYYAKKRKEIVTCELCNCSFKATTKQFHIKTKKHLAKLQAN